MKILTINTVEFRLNGITSVIMNYYRNMNKSDMEIDFVSIDDIDNTYIKEFKKNNSKVYIIKRKSNVLKYFICLLKLMKSNKYDIIHIHGNSATVSIETLAAFIAKIPVRIVHSHNTTCSHKIAHKVLYPIMKKTYTNAIACGNEAGKWLFKNDKFEVLKNGIDLNKFKYNYDISEEYKKKINSKNRLVIGHVGNFVYQKNHDFLIDIFKKLLEVDREFEFVLIGDGPLISDIKEKIKRLNINENICFLGKCTEVNKYLQAIDLFLLPSHHEGLPVVLIEAQALGIPCLVSDKVSEESNITGLVKFLPIDNIDIWIENILEYKRSGSKINTLTHNSIKQNGYDINENAKYMKILYKEYLEKSNK